MKKLLLFFYFLSFCCFSQITTKEERTILTTFVYLHNQLETLKYISSNYPELSEKCKVVKTKFAKKYGIAQTNIHQSVKKIYGNSFESYVSQLNTNLRSYRKVNKMTKEQSLEYLEQIRKRADGLIESPIEETLLKYQQPNFDTAAFKSVYRVESYVKGEKIDLSIEMPQDWKELDGHSPFVLKTFRSNWGHGNEIISIQRNDNPNGISSFTKKMLLASLPPNSHLISSNKKLLNNEYIDRLAYEEVNPLVGSDEKRITTRYFIARDENIIIIDCSVYGKKNENLRSISQKLTSLYESIVQSIHFNNIAKKNIIATINNN